MKYESELKSLITAKGLALIGAERKLSELIASPHTTEDFDLALKNIHEGFEELNRWINYYETSNTEDNNEPLDLLVRNR